MMKVISILILLFSGIAKAETPIQVGTFSLATEAGWGSAFELKNGGKAIVTPSYDHEESEGKNNKNAKHRTIQGTWKTTSDGIEISYSSFKDQFKLERKCKDWKEYPCFRYLKSPSEVKGKSPLNFDYPYINWDWKNK